MVRKRKWPKKASFASGKGPLLICKTPMQDLKHSQRPGRWNGSNFPTGGWADRGALLGRPGRVQAYGPILSPPSHRLQIEMAAIRSSRDVPSPVCNNGASGLMGNGKSTSLQIPKRTWADRRAVASMSRTTGVLAMGSSRRRLSSFRV